MKMDKTQHTPENNGFYASSRKIAALISGICAIGLAVACIYLYVNDEVIPGEGQDPIVSRIFMMSLGVMGCAVCCLVSLNEYLSLKKSDKKDLLIFGLAYVFVGLALCCGILSLKTAGRYGPEQPEQTYLVEEADFTITFPGGLTPIEETSEGDSYYRLYAFSRSKVIYVHIRTGWKPEDWTEADFSGYVKNEFKGIFTNEVFDSARTIHFDDIEAIRIVGRQDGDTFNEFRAIYDILHDSTYVRVVILKDNLSGKPDESFINDCDNIVRSIQFSNK
jgi:hypothetical protein